jgi:hypothetical protein
MTTIEQTDVRQTDTEQIDVDAAAVEEFAAKLIETITGGLLTCLIRDRAPCRAVRAGRRRPGDVC